MKFAALAALTAGTSAYANVSTYSGITGDIEGPGVYTEDGITTTSASGVFWGWPVAGQVHLDPSGFAGNKVTITFGSVFDFTSFDVSYASEGSVLVSGFDALNNLITSTSFTPSSLGTVNFSGFTGLSSVTIEDFNQHFSFDNLTINGAVPEPASWALMIAGFGLVGTTLRRSRRVAVAA